jgi:hypothetical protein
MKNYSLGQKVLGAIVGLFALFGVTVGVNNLGSVSDGQAYNATSTYNYSGAQNLATSVQLKSYGGTFGSVVITGAVAGKIRVQDATSTTDVSSTTITVFPASTAAGTYTFYSAFTRGLIVETVDTLVPTSTITWR